VGKTRPSSTYFAKLSDSVSTQLTKPVLRLPGFPLFGIPDFLEQACDAGKAAEIQDRWCFFEGIGLKRNDC
jgi:hypothetical protein